LLLLVEFHGIRIILKELWMLLKKQLLIRELLRLLDIGSSLENGISLVSASTLISEIGFVPVILPSTDYNVVLCTCIVDLVLLLRLRRNLRLHLSSLRLECLGNNTRDSCAILPLV
jgi:hypothetical protein